MFTFEFRGGASQSNVVGLSFSSSQSGAFDFLTMRKIFASNRMMEFFLLENAEDAREFSPEHCSEFSPGQ